MTKEHAYLKDHQIPLDDKGFLNMDEVSKHVKDYLNQKAYAYGLDYLNFIKNQASLSKHQDIIRLHNLYIEILLEIEDYPSLLNILLSKEKYLQNKKEKAIHFFYMAIAYEGLNQIDQAIDALEKIDETVSSQNLTNKYLKLALLYLKQKRLKDAKAAYEHAKVFDSEMTNDIFLLVRSDILFFEGQTIDAMKVYEDFFIKSKRKWSFLNRFIRLSLALDRKKDAYDFYLRYKDKVMDHSSIQAKKLFFQEILGILKDHYPDDFIEANNVLTSIERKQPLDFDDFNYFHMILNHLRNHTIYDKVRDIVRDLFIDLNQTGAFKKMAYIELVDASIRMYHYSKKLLLEKTIDHTHPIYDDLRNKQAQKTYQKNDIQGFDFVNEDIDYIFIENIEEDKFLVTYLEQAQFDLAKRLTILSSHILKEKFNHLVLQLKQRQDTKALKQVLDHKKQGLFKLHQNQMIPLNDQAKLWLGKNQEMLAYEDFQASLEPKLYIDQLTHQNHFDLTYKGQPYHLTTATIDFDCYLLFEKQGPVQQSQKDDWQAHESHSICLIDIHNHEALIESLSYQHYQMQMNTLIQSLPKLSNHHLLDVLVEANHLFYLLLDTRDKRLPDRLLDKAHQVLGHSYDLRLTYLPFNTPIESMKDRLLHLLSLTTTDEPKQLTEKIIRVNEEKRHLYLQTIQSLIKNKRLKLLDHFVLDWQTHSKKYHVIDVDDLSVLTDKAQLNQVLLNESLAILFDRLVVNQVLEKLKDINQKATWFIPITKASIQSKKALNYLFRRFDIVKQHQFVLLMDDVSYQSLSKSDKDYLYDKDIQLCIKNYSLAINQLMNTDPIDYIIIEPELFEHEFAKEMIQMIEKRFNIIIYNHQDKELLKTKLQALKIDHVMGEYSGRKFL
jgi:hypothetical protein